MIESKRFFLRVSPAYTQVFKESKAQQSALSDDERQHVQHYVMRARLFIANINQRRQTLGRITRCIVELQRDFLENGVRALKPLTRAKVATELDMHESTVSRATAAKYVMLPTGEVIPFSHFFVANLSIKDVIKELVETRADAAHRSGAGRPAQRARYHRCAAHRRQVSRTTEHPAIDAAVRR